MENNKINSFMSPKPAMAFGVLVLASLIISVLSIISPDTKESLSSMGMSFMSFAFGAMFLIMLFSGLLAGIAFNLATRWLKVSSYSFAKAITYLSLNLVVGLIISLILGAIGLSGVIVFLLNLIVAIALLHWYYKVSIPKSIGVFVVGCINSFVLSFLLIMLFGLLGFSVMKALL